MDANPSIQTQAIGTTQVHHLGGLALVLVVRSESNQHLPALKKIANSDFSGVLSSPLA
jgi:hypothetical protein